MIHTASNLHRLRDDVRSRLGKNWQSRYEAAKTLIQSAMAKNGCNEIAAALKLAEFVGKKFQGTERQEGQRMFVAAAVEMIEPSKE